MIEMKMRNDERGDVAGFHPERADMIGEPSVAVIENLALDIAQSVADSGIDENCVAAFHDERAGEVQADAVALVGGMVVFPEFARDHAEHASAVVAPETVGEEGDGE